MTPNAMTPSMHQRTTARGFSLLELMVAVTISLMLLMGVVALFVSSRASYETTEKLSRIQENGRYALDQISNDIRAAGYQGCSRPVGSGTRRADFAINTLPTPDNLLLNFPIPAQGFQGLGGTAFAPDLATALNPVALPNPAPVGSADVLVLRIPLRDFVAMEVASTQVDAAEPLQVRAINPLQPIGPAVITDCLARAWFNITGYDTAANTVVHAASANVDAAGNPSASLRHPFVAGAEIVPLMTVMYYLAPRDPAQPQRLSLYRKEGNNASEEIAEGIDRLEVRYGVDTTNDGRVDSYADANGIPVDAAGLPRWETVYSVQVSLLARAPEAYGTDIDTQQYTLFTAPNAVMAGPFNDRFQRKVFTATAALRNMIID